MPRKRKSGDLLKRFSLSSPGLRRGGRIWSISSSHPPSNREKKRTWNTRILFRPGRGWMQWKHWLPLYLHSKSTRLKRRVLFSLEALQIEGRVGGVNIALVQLFPEQLGSLPEALEVDDLPLPQELDHVVHIRVIGQPQDVVIGYPCFLLCYKSNTQSVTVLPVTVTVRRAWAASSNFSSGRVSARARASLLWGAKAPGQRSGAA